jgi:hypothetical protein
MDRGHDDQTMSSELWGDQIVYQSMDIHSLLLLINYRCSHFTVNGMRQEFSLKLQSGACDKF